MMKVIRTSEESTTLVYGMQCQHLIEKLATDSKLPFGSMHCVVESNSHSYIHNHHEHECFYITRGEGLLTIDSERIQVREGDIVQIPPYLDHTITNLQSTHLHYITFWWEDPSTLPKIQSITKARTSTLIFSTPPTPNGDLHLGHLAGPYIGADIYRRFLELQQLQVFHSTGRDDNQSYILRKALEQKCDPLTLADDYSIRIQRTLAQNGISIDHFGHPRQSPYHVQMVQDMVQLLYDNGWIVEREVPALYCKETGHYLFEAHIRGKCPHCDCDSDGNACEQCGRPNDVVDLITPHSKFGGAGVEQRMIRKLYFRLSAFSDELHRYHRSVCMPAHLSALCKIMLEQGLQDICVSHPVQWGIQIPISGFKEQRVYVWFEMAAGYLAAAQELSEKFGLCKLNDKGWQQFYANENANVVHFFGFDNSYFHAILFPAIYFALDQNIKPPVAFVVNELLNLNGLKFSTSRGHSILGIELLKLVPSDYVRYHLSLIRPETSRTNFTLTEFVSSIQQDLRHTWQVWLRTVLIRAHRLFPSGAPEPGAWTQEQRAFFEQIMQIFNNAKTAYYPQDFSPQRVCHLAKELVREAQRFVQGQIFYENTHGHFDILRTSVALDLLAVKTLSIIMAPIMPDFCARLWHILSPHNIMVWEDNIRFVSSGYILADVPDEFFPSIPEAINDLDK